MLANYNYFSFNNRDHEHWPLGPPPPEVGLSEMLQSCAAPIVGLDKVREIKSESWRMLLYICTICRVRVKISNLSVNFVKPKTVKILPEHRRFQPLGWERGLHARPPDEPRPHAKLLRVRVRHQERGVGANPGK